MTGHLPIQDPDDFDSEDLMNFAEQLLSPLTPQEELERICMTLAHLPTQEAQALLAKFQESPRAEEVIWLDSAIEEGTSHYLTPVNEEEERDLLVLKVIEDLTDALVDLDVELEGLDLDHSMQDIEREAVVALVAAGALDQAEVQRCAEHLTQLESRMEDLSQRIATKEKIMEYLQHTIRSEKFKQADPRAIRHIHLG